MISHQIILIIIRVYLMISYKKMFRLPALSAKVG